MKTRSPDSDDIERAVYDGMQDLRVSRPAAKPRKKLVKRKKRKAAQ